MGLLTCQQCSQQVPHFPDLTEGRVCCPGCGEVLIDAPPTRIAPAAYESPTAEKPTEEPNAVPGVIRAIGLAPLLLFVLALTGLATLGLFALFTEINPDVGRVVIIVCGWMILLSPVLGLLYGLIRLLYGGSPASQTSDQRADSGEPKPDSFADQVRGLTGFTPRSRTGISTEDDARIHRRLIRIGYVFGAVGLLPGIVLMIGAVVLGIAGGIQGDPNGFVVALYATTFLGLPFALFAVGAGIGLLFAPRRFLEGPYGERWLKLVGTRHIPSARCVCYVFLLGFLLIGAVCLKLLILPSLGV
jgi:hypothetical protein